MTNDKQADVNAVTGGPETLELVKQDVKIETMKLFDFRKPGVTGRLFIPVSRRVKGQARHKGETLAAMAARMRGSR